MRQLLCLFGHRWKNFGGNFSKSINLAHLHSRAGNLDLCTRCGNVWDDTGSWVNAHEDSFKEWHRDAELRVRRFAAEHGLVLRGDWRTP